MNKILNGSNGFEKDKDNIFLLLRAHFTSLTNDGFDTNLEYDPKDKVFKFDNTRTDGEEQVRRVADLRYTDDNRFYQFFSLKTVRLEEKLYSINGINLKNFDTYDVRAMVDVFLSDCSNNSINNVGGEIKVQFEELEKGVLGASYAFDNDELIYIKIDPIQWEAASVPIRWYLLYHEPGHDVLNLDHGSGGKMMFNFIDKNYSWDEFWKDRNQMFSTFKSIMNISSLDTKSSIDGDNFFGIDFSRSFYEISNQQALAYFAGKQKAQDGVAWINFDVYKDKIDEEIRDFDFTFFTLGFPVIEDANLDELTPNAFSAYKIYNLGEKTKAYKDFNSLTDLFNSQILKSPNAESDAEILTWETQFFKLKLHLMYLSDGQALQLMYLKK